MYCQWGFCDLEPCSTEMLLVGSLRQAVAAYLSILQLEVPTWPAWPSDQCAQIWSRSVQNCGLEDRETVSSDAPFSIYDHFKKKLCHHEEARRCLLVVQEGRNFAPFHLRRTVFRDMTGYSSCMYYRWGFCDLKPRRTETLPNDNWGQISIRLRQNSMENRCAKNGRRIIRIRKYPLEKQ